MYEANPAPRLLKAAIAIVSLLLIVGLALHFRARTRVRRVKELQAAMANLPPEQRREQFAKLRTAMEQLSPQQRRALGAERQKAFERRMTDYVKMPKAERTRLLDQQIDRMQAFQAQLPPGAFAAGPRPQRNLSASDRDQMRRQRLDATTPEFRSAMDQFRKEMEQRRRERGLPAGGGGRR